jgi:ACT domain-containing protein
MDCGVEKMTDCPESRPGLEWRTAQPEGAEEYVKRIVTDRDLETLAKDGVFLVTSNMILTPFARDFAVQNGIRLEHGDEPPSPDSSPVSDDILDQAIREIILAELAEPESAAPHESLSPLPGISGTEPGGKHAVITTTGMNTTGIIAQITGAISDQGGDIRDISQTLVGGLFTMIAIVDISGLEERGTSFQSFRERLMEVAGDVGVDLNVMHEDILRTMHRI